MALTYNPVLNSLNEVLKPFAVCAWLNGFHGFSGVGVGLGRASVASPLCAHGGTAEGSLRPNIQSHLNDALFYGTGFSSLHIRDTMALFTVDGGLSSGAVLCGLGGLTSSPTYSPFNYHPHPHNFRLQPYMHQTLTPTTFLQSKGICLVEQLLSFLFKKGLGGLSV